MKSKGRPARTATCCAAFRRGGVGRPDRPGPASAAPPDPRSRARTLAVGPRRFRLFRIGCAGVAGRARPHRHDVAPWPRRRAFRSSTGFHGVSARLTGTVRVGLPNDYGGRFCERHPGRVATQLLRSMCFVRCGLAPELSRRRVHNVATLTLAACARIGRAGNLNPCLSTRAHGLGGAIKWTPTPGDPVQIASSTGTALRAAMLGAAVP